MVGAGFHVCEDIYRPRGRERDQIGSWPSHGQHSMSQATVAESAGE